MPSSNEFGFVIPDDLFLAVQKSVEAGDYASPVDALRDAIRIWQRQRSEDANRLKDIRTRIRNSLDDMRPDVTSEDASARLNALFAEAGKGKGPA